MLNEKNLKQRCKPKLNELKTIKTGRGGVKLSHTRTRLLAMIGAFIRGNSRTCPSLRNKAAEPSNLNTSHSRRLRARREGQAENKPQAIFKNSLGATSAENTTACRGTLGFCFLM